MMQYTRYLEPSCFQRERLYGWLTSQTVLRGWMIFPDIIEVLLESHGYDHSTVLDHGSGFENIQTPIFIGMTEYY